MQYLNQPQSGAGCNLTPMQKGLLLEELIGGHYAQIHERVDTRQEQWFTRQPKVDTVFAKGRHTVCALIQRPCRGTPKTKHEGGFVSIDGHTAAPEQAKNRTK